MKWALHKDSGLFVTYAGLQQIRASGRGPVGNELGGRGADVVNVSPDDEIVCTECGSLVSTRVVARGKYNDFATQSDIITFRHSPSRGGGRSDVGNARKCPLYYSQTPLFRDVLRKSPDPEVRERVSAVLSRSDVVIINNALFDALYAVATGRCLSIDARESYKKQALRNFDGAAILEHHPYLLPYAGMSRVSDFSRQGNKGSFKVSLFEEGRGYILFPHSDGRLKQMLVPGKIVLKLFSARGPSPMDRIPAHFPVSAAGIKSLTGFDVPFMKDLWCDVVSPEPQPDPDRLKRAVNVEQLRFPGM